MPALLRGPLAGLALTLSGGAASNPFHGNEKALFELYYALEVASYCGLVSAPVQRGFAARSRRLEGHPELAPARRDHIRGKAWQAAHAEWQNRGLGGFKGWCRAEGGESARWLGSLAP